MLSFRWKSVINDPPRPLQTIHERTDRIQSLVYSPEDHYLAAGCADGSLDVYTIAVDEKYTNVHFRNPNNTLSVTNIDWTEDEKYLQYTGENKEMFLLSTRPALQLVANPTEIGSVWSTLTCLKHRQVEGIWNKFAEKTDIVTIDGNEHLGVIAAGDEQGLIKLFRFPSETRGAHFRKYVGHSSRIGNVAFLHDTSRLISIGTEDRTIMQWRFLAESDSMALVDARRLSVAGVNAKPGGGDEGTSEEFSGDDGQFLENDQQVGAYLDSDSEESDSDLSGAEIDSDIEREKQISYDRTLYREDYQVRRRFDHSSHLSFDGTSSN